MKKIGLLVAGFSLFITLHAQDKKSQRVKEPHKTDVPEMRQCIRTADGNVSLFLANLNDHSQEVDVNTIILDIEKYIDSMPKAKTYADQLLMKQFAPLRHFFLTTTNKTAVATSFLYTDAPYRFCTYNDTATALYIGAVKDDDIYNLGKVTEKTAIKKALVNGLLPSLKALDEFKEADIKYVGMSVYFGCKDTREGAPKDPAVPYCLTLVARLADIQQYGGGMITGKGLLAVGELYISDPDDPNEMRRIMVNVD